MQKKPTKPSQRRRVLARVLAEDLPKVQGGFPTFTRPPEPWMDADFD